MLYLIILGIICSQDDDTKDNKYKIDSLLIVVQH